jgi:hypothetical protein
LKWSKLQNGYGIVHRSVLQMKDLSRGAKLIYALLCSYANKDGECFPSEETMGDDLATSSRSIRAWVRELFLKGMVDRRLSNTMPAHNIYQVMYPTEPTDRKPTSALVRKPASAVIGSLLPPKNTIREDGSAPPPPPKGGEARPSDLLALNTLVHKLSEARRWKRKP